MKSVSISGLKAQLSKYVRLVKRGSEVQVLERGVPVARLVGMQGTAVNEEDWLQRLVQSGVVNPGRGDCSWVLQESPIQMASGANLLQTLLDEREDSY